MTWVSSNLSPTFIWAQDVEIKTEMHITILLATIKHFLHFLLCGKNNNQIRTMQMEWSKKTIFPILFFVFKMHLTGVNFLDDYYIDIW
jgi:membrane protein insertase Oxa1/YidC/SpoIIIJ